MRKSASSYAKQHNCADWSVPLIISYFDIDIYACREPILVLTVLWYWQLTENIRFQYLQDFDTNIDANQRGAFTTTTVTVTV